MKEIIGVYKITNIINNLCYIGISKDIYNRWKYHKQYYIKKNNKLYNAIKIYGINNFKFEIIETFQELNIELLQNREIYWIDYYNSYNNGYNSTIGGSIKLFNMNGENNPNHKLNLNDVIDIRKRYNNHERKKYVYELYKNKIKFRGFEKVWQGLTWKNIMPEVYNSKNKKFHKYNRKRYN